MAQPMAAFSRKNETTVTRLSFIGVSLSAWETTEFDKLSNTQTSQQHDLFGSGAIKCIKVLTHLGHRVIIVFTHSEHLPGLCV